MASLKIVALGTAMALGAVAPALALNAQEEAAFRQYCSGDYMRLCSQYDPGSKEVEQCFQQRRRELSPPCQQAISSFSKNNPQGRRH
jgi:hypothetical protein